MQLQGPVTFFRPLLASATETVALEWMPWSFILLSIISCFLNS